MLTIKQERFAQEYVATGNASEAYRRAYDTQGNPETVAREAHRLVWHPKVAPRIEALQREAAVHAGLTPARIAAFLLADREMAHNTGQIAAAIAADTRLGEMIGVLGTRRHLVEGCVRHEHLHARLSELDADALRVLVALGKQAEETGILPALAEWQEDSAE